MGKLEGKVALISGGARGQGAAEAETFVKEGAKVVFGDIRDDEGKKVEAAIRARGGDAVYVHLDVTSETDWQAAVQTTVSRYGKLDVLINDAAIVIPRVPIEERTAADWEEFLAGIHVPAARVRNLAETLALDQIGQRGLLHRFPEVPDVDRPVTVPVAAFRFAEGGPAVETPPRPLGADTDAVLGELGLTGAEIAALREARVV